MWCQIATDLLGIVRKVGFVWSAADIKSDNPTSRHNLDFFAGQGISLAADDPDAGNVADGNVWTSEMNRV